VKSPLVLLQELALVEDSILKSNLCDQIKIALHGIAQWTSSTPASNYERKEAYGRIEHN
jgi:hypothetical protein